MLKPFRTGLDNMASDLQDAAESGHTKSGGKLTPTTRALVGGAGEMLKMVPVGKDVKESAAALLTPPEISPEARAALKGEKVLDFSKLAGHAEIPPRYAYRSRDVGEVGVPAEALSHAQATLSPDEAKMYTEHRGKTTGKPQELVRFDLNKIDPEHYSAKAGPSGSDWVKLHRPLEESEIEKIVPKESVKVAPKETSPKDVVEKAGLIYKGEVSRGSGVHMFEHPDHPGKTAALNEHQITPENVKEKMKSKIKDFEAGEKAKKQAVEQGTAGLKNIDFKPTKKDAKLPESDKKTLTPKYLLGHENHFDPNTYTPEQLLEKGVLTGMKPVSTT